MTGPDVHEPAVIIRPIGRRVFRVHTAPDDLIAGPTAWVFDSMLEAKDYAHALAARFHLPVRAAYPAKSAPRTRRG